MQSSSWRPLKAKLNAELRRPLDTPLTSPTDLTDPGTLLDAALLHAALERTNPILARAAAERVAAESEVRLSQLSSRPGVSLGFEYISTGEGAPGVPGSGDDPLAVTFSIDLPVNRARYRAVEREARALQRAASATLESEMERLHVVLEEELFAARDAERQITLYRNTLVPRARQAYDATETAYRGGDASFLDLVDAQRALLELALSFERARTDRAIAHARLTHLIGAPVIEPATSEDPR